MQLIIFAGEKNNVPFALESLVMIVREREMMWQVSSVQYLLVIYS